jgi:hypothetical protein
LDDAHEAIFLLGDSYRVAPTDEFVAAVEHTLAPASVMLR